MNAAQSIAARSSVPASALNLRDLQNFIPTLLLKFKISAQIFAILRLNLKRLLAKPPSPPRQGKQATGA